MESAVDLSFVPYTNYTYISKKKFCLILINLFFI
jgi:hypothetical protein